MPRQQGIWRQQWAICDRCGFRHPVGMLVRQKGLLLCTDHGCLDKLDVEQRPYLTQLILTDDREMHDDVQAVHETPVDDLEF